MNRLQILLYLYETVRRVPCSYACQIRLGRRAYRFVDAFFQENPHACRRQLTEAFGEPAEFAQALLEFVDENARAEEFQRKSWTRRAILLLAAGASLLLGGLCALHMEAERASKF